jgi:hypothetical protein
MATTVERFALVMLRRCRMVGNPAKMSIHHGRAGLKSAKQGGSDIRSASPRRVVFGWKNLSRLCS